MYHARLLTSPHAEAPFEAEKLEERLLSRSSSKQERKKRTFRVVEIEKKRKLRVTEFEFVFRICMELVASSWLKSNPVVIYQYS